MAVASLVLGIISLIIGFIPFCGMIAFVPAIIALILGIVAIVQNKKKGEGIGMAVAGTILSALAVIIMFFWFVVLGAAVGNADLNELNSILSNIESMPSNSFYYNF